LLHEVDLSGAPAASEVKICSNLDVHPLWGWAPSDGLSVGGVSRLPV
jgi:4-diphosphocytidyl-2-C-methyl-D-erythritol kinase